MIPRRTLNPLWLRIRRAAPREAPRVQPSGGEAADCCAGGVVSESEPLLLGDGHAGKCCHKGDCSPANGPDERERSVAVQIYDDEDAEASESEPLVSKTAAKPTAIEIVEAEGDQLEVPRSPSNVPTTTKLRVPNICCAMEAKLVEDTLKPLHGVQSVSVNVIGRVAYVRHVPSLTSAADLVTVLKRSAPGREYHGVGCAWAGRVGRCPAARAEAFLVFTCSSRQR